MFLGTKGLSISIQNLRFYLTFVRPHADTLLLVLLVSSLLTGIAMTIPLISRVIFDYAYPLQNVSLLTWAILGGFAIFLFSFVLDYAESFLTFYLEQDVYYKLSAATFDRLQHLSPQSHRGRTAGDIQINLNDDAAHVQTFLTQSVKTIVLNLLEFLILLVITWNIDKTLTLITLLTIPFYILETHFFARHQADLHRQHQKANSDHVDNIIEKSQNFRAIQTFSQQPRELDFFYKKVNRIIHLGIKSGLIDLTADFCNSFVTKVWTMFTAWFLGYQVIQGHITVGEVVAMTMYLTQINKPVQALSGWYGELKIAAVAFERLNKIFLADDPVADTKDAQPLDTVHGGIRFEKVDFSYDAGKQILQNLDLTVTAGKMTAVVGATGAGKTTLINLLLRFYDPDRGRILLDGIDIRNFHLQDLRGVFGLVTQDVVLFPMSVADNISYGQPHATKDQIIEACKAAEADEFIIRLSEGYETVLESMGKNLSPGQRQRLAIARAVLRRPSIFIFDEATSALDSHSEHLIKRALVTITSGKTSIYIAHRLSTITEADQIVVLDNGRVKESGNFQELLERKGSFYRYYQYQFGAS